jgi:hypothetical protein
MKYTSFQLERHIDQYENWLQILKDPCSLAPYFQPALSDLAKLRLPNTAMVKIPLAPITWFSEPKSL